MSRAAKLIVDLSIYALAIVGAAVAADWLDANGPLPGTLNSAVVVFGWVAVLALLSWFGERGEWQLELNRRQEFLHKSVHRKNFANPQCSHCHSSGWINRRALSRETSRSHHADHDAPSALQ